MRPGFAVLAPPSGATIDAWPLIITGDPFAAGCQVAFPFCTNNCQGFHRAGDLTLVYFASIACIVTAANGNGAPRREVRP